MRARTLLPLLCAAVLVACEGLTGPFSGSSRQGDAEVSAGAHHTCAIGTDGRAYCWGERLYVQLGTTRAGPCEDDWCLRPLAVSGNAPTSDIAAGRAHSCAIMGGMLNCWGANREGQLGDSRLVVTTCPRMPYLRCSPTPFPVALGFAVAAVDGARDHTCAIRLNGALYCWGRNPAGQVGSADTKDRNVPVVVETGAPVADVGTGEAHTCAVNVDGRAYCWGEGSAGRLGNGGTAPSLEPALVAGGHFFTAVAVGGAHACGLSAAGRVLCWGQGSAGQVGDSAGTSAATPVAAALPEPAVAVSAGWEHTCALAASGRLYCWGSNAFGQIGNGSRIDRLSPTPVELAAVRSVSAGEGHTCAVTEEDVVYCWGANASGQLGIGTRVGAATPRWVGAL